MDGPDPDRIALLSALATLPAVQRRAMMLRYLVDLPIAEIAAREGVAEATVRSVPDQLTELSEEETRAAFVALRETAIT